MKPTAQKHLDAIRTGEVTRENVIGLRKMINASERKLQGFSISATACHVDFDDLDLIESEIARVQPRVAGKLHETGLALLRSSRHAKRLQSLPLADIAEFRLQGFDRLGNLGLHSVPVYRVGDSLGRDFSFSAISLGNRVVMVLKSKGGISNASEN